MALTLAVVRTANTPMGKKCVATCTFDNDFDGPGETLDLTAAPFTGANAFTSTYYVKAVEGPYDSDGVKIDPSVCSSIHYEPAASRAVATGILVAFAEQATPEGVQAIVADNTDLSTVLCRLLIVGT